MRRVRDTQEVREVEVGGGERERRSEYGGTGGMKGSLLLCHNQRHNLVQLYKDSGLGSEM